MEMWEWKEFGYILEVKSMVFVGLDVEDVGKREMLNSFWYFGFCKRVSNDNIYWDGEDWGRKRFGGLEEKSVFLFWFC